MKADAPKTGVTAAGLTAYLLAAVFVLLTGGICLLAGSGMTGGDLVIFTIPIMLTAYLGGLGPGLLATALAHFGAPYFLPPVVGFAGPQFVLVFSGALISAGCEALRRARRRAETSRLDSERLAAIVESSDDAIIGKDLAGIVVSWNKGAERLFGYTAAEMVGSTIMKIVPPDRQEEETEILQKIRRGENIDHFETRRQARDGRLVDISVTASPIRDAGGRIVGISKVARDIAERKQIEEIRRDLGERLTTTIENMDAGFVTVDRSWRFTYVNRAAEKILQRPRAGLLGREIWEVFEGRDGTFGRNYRRAVAENRAVAFEEYYPPMGLWFEVNAYPSPDGLAVYFRDITRGKQAVLARERSELALRESEELFSKAFLLSPDCVVIVRLADRIVVKANDAMCRLWGTTPAEAAGRPSSEFTTWLNEADRVVLMQALADKGECLDYEARLRLRDGREVVFNVSCRLITLNREPCVLSVLRDMTERRQAATALHESELRFATAFRSSPVAIAINRRRDLVNLEVNDSFLRLFECTREEIIGRTLPELDLVDPETMAALGRELDAAGSLDSTALAARTRRGRPLHLDLSVRVIQLGGQDCALSTAVDVTAAKAVETALRESEDRFRTMANSMSQLAWIAGPDGAIQWYNQRWYEYTGTTPAQMEGWGWQSVHEPRMLGKVMAQWQAAIASGRFFEMEFPLRGADGVFRTFLSRGQPLKDATGRVTHWFGTNTDVETLKAAEEKIHRLNAELEQRVAHRTEQLVAANKELESFSYSVSHDLRAPLRAVDGFSQAMIEDYGPQLPEEGRRKLATIRQSAQRMGALIDDLLTFSRLGREVLRKAQVDTGLLVQEALRELEFPARYPRAEIHTGELPPGLGDPALLKQVWVNLLDNALKYSRNRDRAVIEIGCDHHSGEAVYFIKDNGTGFDMKYADKLFGVFQRLHRMEEYEGTGVGLATVQRIVHRHGGRVWAEAAPDSGATFYFTLPAN